MLLMEAESERQLREWPKKMIEGTEVRRPILLHDWKMAPQTSQRNNAKTPLRNSAIIL